MESENKFEESSEFLRVMVGENFADKICSLGLEIDESHDTELLTSLEELSLSDLTVSLTLTEPHEDKDLCRVSKVQRQICTHLLYTFRLDD